MDRAATAELRESGAGEGGGADGQRTGECEREGVEPQTATNRAQAERSSVRRGISTETMMESTQQERIASRRKGTARPM